MRFIASIRSPKCDPQGQCFLILMDPRTTYQLKVLESHRPFCCRLPIRRASALLYRDRYEVFHERGFIMVAEGNVEKKTTGQPPKRTLFKPRSWVNIPESNGILNDTLRMTVAHRYTVKVSWAKYPYCLPQSAKTLTVAISTPE